MTVKEQTFDLEIDDMHCAGCVGRVERALMQEPGVSKACVNLVTKRARVDVNDTVNPESLVDAVRRIGFRAHLCKKN